MIQFERFQLPNGLKLIVSQNKNSPFAYMSILYNVGSKHENPNRTGFAHLFEHLMFSGTERVPDFDEPLQRAGGENNAFTNADYTHFYNYAPVENLELMLFLEADRMQNLRLSPQKLNKEKQIVVEEFYETCLNMPYGDIWHHLYPLAFQKHPYAWPTIGKAPEHIQEADLEDIQRFYENYYTPENAILSIVSPLEVKEVKAAVEAHFGDNADRMHFTPSLPQEPVQQERRERQVQSKKIPHSALYMAFHIPNRLHQAYRLADIYTDILSGGRSSRFYENLYKKTNYFAELDAYITGTIDPGLLIVEAKLKEGTGFDIAEKLLWNELKAIEEEGLAQETLNTFTNLAESNMLFSNTQGLNTAIQLAYFEACGQVDFINTELDVYKKIRTEEIIDFVKMNIQADKASVVYVEKVKRK